MPSGTNHQIRLAARPTGAPTPANFEATDTPIPIPGPGELLGRTIYLSLDPYMRGRMNTGNSYTSHVKLGEVMVGGAVSEVMESNHPDYSTGEIVFAYSGWQQYFVSNGEGLSKVDPRLGPISTAVGVLGMPGMTAYTGLLNIGKPQPGETLVVAAASGPVGSLVGQIAKIKGCRVVGIAGGQAKCNHVVNELGFDTCLDHRARDLPERLAAACPDGIDIYYENVGGSVFEAVLPLFNEFARMPVIGTVAHYNATELPPGPNKTPLFMRAILTKRITVRGMIVWDFADQEQDFLRDVSGWIRDSRVKYREDFVDGLDNAPEAFIGMLEGKNFGKLVVRVGTDPTA